MGVNQALLTEKLKKKKSRKGFAVRTFDLQTVLSGVGRSLIWKQGLSKTEQVKSSCE
jgi:hypothetical protein